MQMTIPYSDGLRLKKWLCVIAYDSYYADSFLSGLVTDVGQRSRWQRAVDTVYRLLSAGLIAPGGNEREATNRANFYMPYVEKLARNDPFLPVVDPVWFDWDLCGTSLCRSLVERHRLGYQRDDTASGSFLDEIASLFVAATVPWASHPLIPIKGWS